MIRKQNLASRMRYRLTLQGAVEQADGAGGVSCVWSDIANLWADVMRVTSSERVQAGQFAARQEYKIILRHRMDVDETKRFLWGERVLAITSVNDSLRYDGMLEVLVSEEPESQLT